MIPLAYQRLAARTECDYDKAAVKLNGAAIWKDADGIVINQFKVVHAAIGLAGEVGELNSNIQKWIYYGQGMNVQNLIEEGGDCLWYLALLFNTLGVDMSKVMEANIAKLKRRYPDKFSEEKSIEENRDREKENEDWYKIIREKKV